MTDASDIVYFIKGDGRIKIGTTSCPVRQRLQALAANTPEDLNLIGTIPGGRFLEKAIHRRCAAWHMKNEWFRDTSDLRSLIKRIIDDGALAADIDPHAVEIDIRRREKVRAEDEEIERGKLGRIFRLIWPNNVLEEMRAISGADPETILSWLDHGVKPPLIVRHVLSSVALQFLYGEVVSFVQPEESSV